MCCVCYELGLGSTLVCKAYHSKASKLLKNVPMSTPLPWLLLYDTVCLCSRATTSSGDLESCANPPPVYAFCVQKLLAFTTRMTFGLCVDLTTGNSQYRPTSAFQSKHSCILHTAWPYLHTVRAAYNLNIVSPSLSL